MNTRVEFRGLMPADLVSAPSTTPWPLAYLIRCGPPTANCLPGVEQDASPGHNAPGISPQLMWKLPPPGWVPLSMFYTVSQIPEFTQWPTKSNPLDNTLIISFLPLLDSFPHSPPELPGITFQINYLLQILLLTFWLQFHRSNPSNPYLREYF